MSDVEKVMYILKASLHSLPNDKALEFIARVIINTLNEHERCDFDCANCRED